MATFSLSQEQYEALVALARRGATTTEEARNLDAFLKDIEKSNGITRYTLLVRWQEMNQPLPPNTDFPTIWPPELQARIDLTTRPIAKADVTALLNKKAKQPINVTVTTDPGGIVGWTQLNNFFL